MAGGSTVSVTHELQLPQGSVRVHIDRLIRLVQEMDQLALTQGPISYGGYSIKSTHSTASGQTHIEVRRGKAGTGCGSTILLLAALLAAACASL